MLASSCFASASTVDSKEVEDIVDILLGEDGQTYDVHSLETGHQSFVSYRGLMRAPVWNLISTPKQETMVPRYKRAISVDGDDTYQTLPLERHWLYTVSIQQAR